MKQLFYCLCSGTFFLFRFIIWGSKPTLHHIHGKGLVIHTTINKVLFHFLHVDANCIHAKFSSYHMLSRSGLHVEFYKIYKFLRGRKEDASVFVLVLSDHFSVIGFSYQGYCCVIRPGTTAIQRRE